MTSSMHFQNKENSLLQYMTMYMQHTLLWGFQVTCENLKFKIKFSYYMYEHWLHLPLL